jgi:hypothetical protein
MTTTFAGDPKRCLLLKIPAIQCSMCLSENRNTQKPPKAGDFIQRDCIVFVSFQTVDMPVSERDKRMRSSPVGLNVT